MREGNLNASSTFSLKVVMQTLCTFAVALMVFGLTTTSSSAAPTLPCAAAPAVYPTSPASGASRLGTDPVGPFPLDALQPFPWASIEGIWTGSLPDGTQVYFSFEVKTDCQRKKLLEVLAFDQKSMRVTAEGTGLAASNDTMVRAAMTSGSVNYMVFIRQYKTKATPKVRARIVNVITIRPFNGTEADDIHLPIRKISTLSLPALIRQQQEAEAAAQAEAARRRSQQ